jgi:phenylacetic acid degradation operon negative regulatory protein
MLERWRSTRSRPSERCFADYVRALTLWRRLPYLDPGLPTALLPPDWKGTEAADTFFELKELLEGPAHEFADDVIGDSEAEVQN